MLAFHTLLADWLARQDRSDEVGEILAQALDTRAMLILAQMPSARLARARTVIARTRNVRRAYRRLRGVVTYTQFLAVYWTRYRDEW